MQEEDTLATRIKQAYAGAEPPPLTPSRNTASASFASSPPPGAGTPCSPAPFAFAPSVSIASEDYEAEWEPPVGPKTALDRLLLAGLLVFDMTVLAFVVVMLAVIMF